MARPTDRTWVMPLIFALVLLAMPVQLVVAHRVSEPFPGLFFPAFGNVPDMTSVGYEFTEATFVVDGKLRMDAGQVLGVPEVTRQRRLARQHFPRHPDGPVRLPAHLRETIIDNLTRSSGDVPTSLDVVWKRRVYDTRQGKVVDVRTISSYPVDLREAT